MQAFFKEISRQVDFNESFRRALDESGLGFLSIEQAKTLISMTGGGDVEAVTRGFLNQFIDRMPEHLNTTENIDALLERVASRQLLLSLSERPDSSPMWAHYAANSTGFVIAFDTTSDFFRRGEDRELQGLHKVTYFDGRVSEIIENPFAALISKQADWAYEREWRLYVNTSDVTRILEVKADTIHLVNFPRPAVSRVILGLLTSEQDEASIRAILQTSYPHTELTRMQADRATATLIELPAN